MAQGVTYADLRFVRASPEKTQQKETGGEEELTYENVQGPRPREEDETAGSPQENKGSDPWIRPAALGVLGACLFLLATAVGLGVRYWQVSGQLQRASQDHAARSSSLARRIDTQEESLAQIKDRLHQAWRELNSTQRDLLESRAATERTQERLQEVEEELRRANLSLDALGREKEETEAELRQARSCQQIGCCAPEWKLFRWKCLWVSREKTTWWESERVCKGKSSQLLILRRPWNAKELWDAVVVEKGAETSQNLNSYWIGLKRVQSELWTWTQTRTRTWTWTWTWVDGSSYEGPEIYADSNNQYFGKLNDGTLSAEKNSQHQYICEKAASPLPVCC